MGETTTSPATFFGTLHNEELENVLYNLSARPNRANWHMPDEDLEPLLASSSPLRDACRTFFLPRRQPAWYEFWGCCVLFERAECLLACADMLHSVALSGENIASLPAKQLSRRAGMLRNLFLTSIRATTPDEGRQAYKEVLRAVGSRLEALRFEGEWRGWLPRIVMRECPNLIKLEIEGSFQGAAACPRFWHTVGGNLQELDIVYPKRENDDPISARGEINEILQIRQYCPKLHALSVLAPLAANQDLVDTLVQYGQSLRFTLANSLTPQLAIKLVRGCPNARIRTIVTDPAHAPEVFRALGPQTDEVAVHFDFHGIPDVFRGSCIMALRESVSACAPVKRLFASNLIAVDAFAATNLHELRTITLDFNGDCANEDTLLALAVHTGAITRATIHCTPIAVGAVNRLVAANRDLVALELHIQSHDPLDLTLPHVAAPYYATVVRALSVFSDLREIEIKPRFDHREDMYGEQYVARYNLVADACVPLRNRKMFVVVAGHLYLPEDKKYTHPKRDDHISP